MKNSLLAHLQLDHVLLAVNDPQGAIDRVQGPDVSGAVPPLAVGVVVESAVGGGVLTFVVALCQAPSRHYYFSTSTILVCNLKGGKTSMPKKW